MLEKEKVHKKVDNNNKRTEMNKIENTQNSEFQEWKQNINYRKNINQIYYS